MDANNVRQQWADRSGEYSPAYYAHYGPNETSELIRSSVEQYLDGDASILELGCSSGRHLAHLHDAGFESLAGIDINDEAFDVMGEAYPDLAADGTFHVAAIEDAVREFDDDEFDAVYSAETLQHIHPDDEWVFAELARITGDVLVTAEIEEAVVEDDSADAGSPDTAATTPSELNAGTAADDGTDAGPADADVNYVHGEVPLYYRDWGEVFSGLGFEQVDVARSKRDTVRTFRVERV